MKPNTSRKEFEQLIKVRGLRLSDMTPTQGIKLMFDFYRDLRADGCELDGDGDMLLIQWGTYSGSEDSKTFQFDITRQFIETEDDEDQGAMSQLSFTFHFIPSPETEVLKSENRWCSNPGDLVDFEAFIIGNPAYKLVAEAKPAKVTLDFSLV